MEGCQTWCDGHHVILKKKSNSSSADQGMVSGKTRTSMALTWPRLWRDVQSRGSEFDLMAMPGWHEGFKEVELWILCVGSPGSTSYWAGCLIWTSWFCILSVTYPSIEALLLQVSESTFAPVWDDPWHHTPLPGSIFDSPLWITSIPSAWYPKASKRGGVAKQQNAPGKHQEGFGGKKLQWAWRW